MMMQAAVESGCLARNPCSGVRLPEVTTREMRVHVGARSERSRSVLLGRADQYEDVAQSSQIDVLCAFSSC